MWQDHGGKIMVEFDEQTVAAVDISVLNCVQIGTLLAIQGISV